MKKKNLSCKTVQIKNLSDEKIYPPENFSENKNFIFKKISENISRSLVFRDL